MTHKGWMLYDRAEAQRNQEYIQLYEDACRERFPQLSIQVVLLEELDFGVWDGKAALWYQGEPVDPPDFAICRMRYPLLTRQLEQMGVRCFNCYDTALLCNDKARTGQLAAGLGVPVIDTRFYKNKYKASALRWERFPAIVKTAGGHGGKNVFLARDRRELEDALEQMGHWDFVVQPQVEGPPGQPPRDLRVYVVGNRICAAVLRSAREGYRANYGLGGSARLYELSDGQKKLVERILSQVRLDLGGVDFLFDRQGELVFNEIEDVVGARMLYACSQVDLVGEYLEHIARCLSHTKE